MDFRSAGWEKEIIGVVQHGELIYFRIFYDWEKIPKETIITCNPAEKESRRTKEIEATRRGKHRAWECLKAKGQEAEFASLSFKAVCN